MARKHEHSPTSNNHPDCVLTDSGYVIRWEDATEEQKQRYYYDLQGEARSLRDPDTGARKGKRKKGRPGRSRR